MDHLIDVGFVTKPMRTAEQAGTGQEASVFLSLHFGLNVDLDKVCTLLTTRFTDVRSLIHKKIDYRMGGHKQAIKIIIEVPESQRPTAAALAMELSQALLSKQLSAGSRRFNCQ